MAKLACEVIEDLLALYVDDVVSDETKRLVDEHLRTCNTCRASYEQMSQTIYVPIDTNITGLQRVNKSWKRKKWLSIVGSALVTGALGFAIFSYVFHYKTPIDYSSDLVKIEEQEDGVLTSNYYGESYARIQMSHPITIEQDGVKKNIAFVLYEKSIAHSPTTNYLSPTNEAVDIFTLPDSKQVDEIYYGEHSEAFEDVIELDEEKQNDFWLEHLQTMTLIWERQ